MRKTKKPKTIKIGRIAKRMRVVVFKDRDRVYSKRLKRFTKKFGPWYWVAGDVTSYHLGTGDDPVAAVRSLIASVQANRFMVADEEAKGVRVIQWRCDLDKKERAEWERKAKETGFALDGVEILGWPKRWDCWVGKTKWRPVKMKKGRIS